MANTKSSRSKKETPKRKTAPRSETTRASVTSSRKKVPASKEFNVIEYFRRGESYTGLVVGIVFVIIATLILAAFLKNLHMTKVQKPTQDISYDRTGPSQISLQPTQFSLTLTPTPMETSTPTATLTPEATVTPLAGTSATPTPVPFPPRSGTVKEITYTVKAGDDLWHIAESQYNDGFKWVEIARANNLASPSYIHVGDKLVIPAIMNTGQVAQNQPTTLQNGATAGATYTVVKGDDLWDIAVRAYNNGYRWVDIAKANNLINPNVIHSGNILTLPR